MTRPQWQLDKSVKVIHLVCTSHLVLFQCILGIKLFRTHSKEFRTGLVDGHYDDAVPPGQLRQQHYDLVGRHTVQACGWLIQEDHLCESRKSRNC